MNDVLVCRVFTEVKYRISVLLGVAIAGCTSAGGDTTTIALPEPTSTSTRPITSTSLATTTSLSEPGDLHFRGCDQSIGQSNIGAPDLSNDIWVYPVLFGNAATFHLVPSDFWGRRAGDYRFPAFKVPYAIAAGETVRIEVSEDDIEWATLHGGGFNSDGHYFLGEGFGAVEYQACEATDTLFNGGIIASRPGCLHLRVIHDGEEHDVRIGLALTCA